MLKMTAFWDIAPCSLVGDSLSYSTYCLLYIRLPKTPNHYIFTLKMATEMFVETVGNFQHSTWLIPESWSCALNSSRENLRAGILIRCLVKYILKLVVFRLLLCRK
jgi:hypothetical protein